VWDETVRDIDLIWVEREEKYFYNQDWTGEIALKLQEFFLATRYESQDDGSIRGWPFIPHLPSIRQSRCRLSIRRI
jgi:hypothetical protein